MLELASDPRVTSYDTIVESNKSLRRIKKESIREYLHGYLNIVIEERDIDDIAEILGMSPEDSETYTHAQFLEDQKKLIWDNNNYNNIKNIFQIINMLDDVIPTSCPDRRLKFFIHPKENGMMWIF